MAIDTTEASLYGVGRGAAQIWGPNRGLQGLEQAYQQDLLRRQKEDAQMQEEIAKINYDAARPQDLPGVLKRYDEIKNTYAQLRGTQNRMDRIKLQTKINEQKSNLSNFVAMSKQAGSQLGDLGKLRLTNPDELSDDFVPTYSKISSLSIEHPDFTKSVENLTANALQKKFDKLAFDKKILDASVENIPESGVKKQDLGGGNIAYYTEKGTRLNPQALKENIVNAIKSDKGAMRTIKSLYKDLTLDEGAQRYAEDLYNSSRGRYDKMEKTGASVKNPNEWYNQYNYRLAHPIAPQFIGVPQSITIPFGTKPSDNIEIPNYVPITKSKQNFAGAVPIDLKTGKPSTKLAPSNDYEIVGVGNVPFIKQGAQKGAISQPDFAKNNPQFIEERAVIHVQAPPVRSGGKVRDYFIPYDRLPENIKNTKAIAGALANFKPATGAKKELPKAVTSKFKNVPKGGF